MKPKQLLKDILCIASSAVLLSLIFAPFDMNFLAWIAYVPLVSGLIYTQYKKTYIFMAFLASVGYWLFNVYWLINIIAIGLIGTSIAMAVFHLIFIFMLCICLKRNYPLWICLPILITGIEFAYSVPFGGFEWHLLGHCMYNNLSMIQIADITGVAGISFTIAMVNGLICDLIRTRKPRPLALPASICAVVVLSVFAYGRYRIATEPANFTDGPLIGIIQTNIPSAIKEDKFEGENILQDLFEQSEQCLESGATLLVWPETIISAAINNDLLIYSHENSDAWKYHTKLRDFVKDRTYLIAGATSLKVADVDGTLKVTNQYNSAFLYQPDGSQYDKRYDKIHLVPFGEYIPPQNVPWIKNFFMSFSPYDYDYTLTPGTELVRFNADLEGQNWNFATIICYEDTDARLNPKLLYSPDKGKAHWLLNISNDGWYVWYKDGEIKPSIELPQRTAISVFRAVENRVTLLRSVNTGISCKIDPLGRIIDGYISGTLPYKAMDRQAVAGWFTDRPQIDNRITVFTRIGILFSKLCGIALIAMLLLPLLRRVRRRERRPRRSIL